MCYYYKSPSILKIQDKEVHVDLGNVSGFNNQIIPIFCNINMDFTDSLWGFLPNISNSEPKLPLTLNARLETINEKKTYSDSVDNRCIILADGFYEWQWLNKSGSKKRKFFIHNVDHSPIYLAGIYKDWNLPNINQSMRTFTIITTAANELMSEIHNTKKRMPMSINPKDINTWLSAQVRIEECLYQPNWKADLSGNNQTPELWD